MARAWRDERIAELEAVVAAKDVRIAELEQQVSALPQQVALLMKRVAELTAKLDQNFRRNERGEFDCAPSLHDTKAEANVEQKTRTRDMPRRESVVPKDMKDIHERFRYSPGVKAGPLLFIAGQVGRDENLNVVEGKEAQFVQAFENVKKVLTAAGVTFDDVVEMVTYHTDMRDLQLLMKVKDQYVTNLDRLPTWTAIGTTALAMPGLFVEIKCTALLPD